MTAMTLPDPDAAGPMRNVADVAALPGAAFIASSADDGSDAETWVGYESLHPMTWVPAHSGRGSD